MDKVQLINQLSEIIEMKDKEIELLKTELSATKKSLTKARQCTIDVVKNCYLNDN